MGERFGRYELLHRLGAGGMAEVFVAKTFGAEGFVKELVIKRILPAFNEDPDFVTMFINEARLAARLQHANIVQIFDFNHVDGMYYIAMEWVDGLDLRSVFNTARRRAMPLPQRIAVHVGVETLKGLHYAHTKSERGKPLGLVHRDISPHNLLVSFAGEIKITDFGIAKAAAIASATRSGAVKGKLAYMSPEQVSSAPVDARSDLFSLGVVLWELLAGQRLYQAGSEGELFAKVRLAHVPPLAPLAAEVSTDLEHVIRRLLAVNPEERYATAADALSELSRFAGADDTLQVASYLRRLLPGEAARERRGETQLDPPPNTGPIPFRVSPQAPTRSRSAAVGPTELGLGPAPSSSQVRAIPSAEQPSVEPKRRNASRRGLLAALCVVSFAACAVAGHWLASHSTAAPVATASLLVETEPAGAEVWAEGLPLGPAPLSVHGEPGKRVRLRARWSVRGEERGETIQLGSAEKIRMEAPGQPTIARRPNGDEILGRAIEGKQKKTTSPEKKPSPETASLPPPRLPKGEPPPRPKPASTPKPRKARAPERPAGWATLDVLVAPWARVRIDGEDRGQTPLRDIKLSAGPHLVEVFNPELGQRAKEKLRLKPNEHAVVRKKWTP